MAPVPMEPVLPNQNADLGASFRAMPERSVEILSFVSLETDVRSIITGTHMCKIISRLRKAHELNSESSNNRSPTIFVVTRVCGFHIQT